MSFDLDATLGLPFTFTFGGDTYTLPSDVDMAALQALRAEEPEKALQAMLGDEQWQRLQESPAVFGVRAWSKLIDAYFTHLGLRNPESGASSDSSKSTAGPSNPTFSGSTESPSRGSVTALTG